MNPEDIGLEFHDPDPITNTQKVTITVPDHVDPMVAKQMLRNALRDPVAVETWRVELSKIEKESK
nr:MAG TPA: hypothetical protein [Siphovirus LN-2020-1]FAA02855.1 MAG TPA: hypothetical protein [Siphovirus LN-2020-1]